MEGKRLVANWHRQFGVRGPMFLQVFYGAELENFYHLTWDFLSGSLVEDMGVNS